MEWRHQCGTEEKGLGGMYSHFVVEASIVQTPCDASEAGLRVPSSSNKPDKSTGPSCRMALWRPRVQRSQGSPLLHSSFARNFLPYDQDESAQCWS